MKLFEVLQSQVVHSYVIRDDGSHNPAFVEQEFQKFKTWIGELAITRLS